MPQIEKVVRLANECQRLAPYTLKGYVPQAGQPSGIRLKGEHFLDFRLRKTMARLMHEAKLITLRDRKALRFLGKHVRAKLPR